MRSKLLFVTVAVIVILLDRLSKNWVMVNLPLGGQRRLLPFLWLTNTENSGAAFGLGQSHALLLLIASVVIGVGIIFYVLRSRIKWPEGVLLGLVMGGAVGNAWDRLLDGRVTDFLDLHWWPVFNLADAAISVGIVLLIGGYLLRQSYANSN
ncbi:MAG: signal peptidase II [Candidatus Dormibacteraceae bacterium]